MVQDQTRKTSLYCSLMYFASYILRLGFAAGLVEIMSDVGITKSEAGLVTTGLFIFYGAGQFLSGYLGDRLEPRKLMLFGMLATALCNIGLILSSNYIAMAILWCINGLMQAFIWPPMTRIMAEVLDERGYMHASKMASIAANAATIAVYAAMSMFAYLHLWRLYFVLSAVIGSVIAVISYIGFGKLQPIHAVTPKETRAEPMGEKPHLGKIMLLSGLPLIMLSIVMQGMLRDGVTTWMPTIITETTNSASASSILSAAVLPLFAMGCITVAGEIQKRQPNDMLSSIGMYAVAAASALLILPFIGKSGIAIAILMAVITACAHGINFLLICHVPSYFRKYNCVSLVSGVINSCTYIGSALSTYGIAVLSEKYGWNVTIAIWAAIALLGGLACLLAMRPWKKFAGITK